MEVAEDLLREGKRYGIHAAVTIAKTPCVSPSDIPCPTCRETPIKLSIQVPYKKLLQGTLDGRRDIVGREAIIGYDFLLNHDAARNQAN